MSPSRLLSDLHGPADSFRPFHWISCRMRMAGHATTMAIEKSMKVALNQDDD
jgi:hypothetical protein